MDNGFKQHLQEAKGHISKAVESLGKIDLPREQIRNGYEKAQLEAQRLYNEYINKIMGTVNVFGKK